MAKNNSNTIYLYHGVDLGNYKCNNSPLLWCPSSSAPSTLQSYIKWPTEQSRRQRQTPAISISAQHQKKGTGHLQINCFYKFKFALLLSSELKVAVVLTFGICKAELSSTFGIVTHSWGRSKCGGISCCCVLVSVVAVVTICRFFVLRLWLATINYSLKIPHYKGL